MTGIIAAMKTELELIRNKLDNVTEEKHGGLVFYRGSYKGKETVAAICGIGKVYASMCAEAMTLLYAPDVIINTGVAGALSDKLHMTNAFSMIWTRRLWAIPSALFRVSAKFIFPQIRI